MHYIVWFGIDGKLNRFNQIHLMVNLPQKVFVK